MPWMTLGDALGYGLAQGVNNFVSTNNQFEQQRQQQANILVDQQYRQAQADEQRRQFESQQRQARDTQTFQWLNGQQQQLTQILAKGGFAKGSPEYQAAETALKETNKLMGKVVKGQDLTPEEQQGYDALLGNVGAITGQGAAVIGGRVTERENADLGAVTAGTVATTDANTRANELHPFSVARAGLENTALGQQNAENAALTPFRVNIARVQSEYAEPLADAGLRQATATAGLSELELGKVNATLDSTIKLINDKNDFDSAYLGVQKGLLKLTGAAMQSDYLSKIAATGGVGAQVVKKLVADGELDPDVAQAVTTQASRVETTEDTKLAILKDQAAITDNDRQYSDKILKNRIDLFNGNADLQIKTDAAELDLLKFKTPAQRAAYLDGIAKTGAGGQAILDGLVKAGVIDQPTADGFKKTAANTQTVQDAGAQGAATAADTAAFNLESARTLFPVQLKSAQTALETAQQALNEARAGQPLRIDLLRTQVATLKQDLSQNAQLFGPKLAQAQAVVRQLESEIRVLEGTEGARISLAGSQADAAAAGATSAQAQAQVDVATIPAMVASRNLAPQQAQAALNAQLLENRFADTTFGARVKAVNLNNSTATQQLLALKQQYSQNAAKFPAELKYLNAQIAVQEANAKESAARAIDATGNGVTDKKSMLQALDSMRKINADERRIASTNFQNTVRRLMPNARFSVDKYDAKNFTAMVSSTANLTPEQRQELEQAQLAFDAASSKATDLSTAFAQVAGIGRIDPNVAERLGMFTPDTTGASLTLPQADQSGRLTLDPAVVTKWIADNPEDKTGPNGTSGVSSDCAYIGGKFLNELGFSIKPSNNAAQLEKNAREGGWKPLPFKLGSPAANKAMQVGDLVVWTSHGKIKYGQNSGKHTAVVAGFDAQGNPMLVNNAGLKADGTQSKTALIPMFDPEGAVAYRSPQAGGLQRGTGSAPAAPSGTGPAKPLTIQAAKPLIQQAKTPAALEGIQRQLEAAGMKPGEATQYIRDVKQGKK